MNKNTKTAFIVIGITMALLIILPFVFGPRIGWQMGCWSPWSANMMGGLGLWWLVPLLWLTFIALIGWAVISLVRGMSSTQSEKVPSRRRSTALEVLENRYASGEITRKEFEAKKKDLLE